MIAGYGEAATRLRPSRSRPSDAALCRVGSVVLVLAHQVLCSRTVLGASYENVAAELTRPLAPMNALQRTQRQVLYSSHHVTGFYLLQQ